ncbi:MAG: hypothetical protein HC884_14855 [Chloroflexaceae bacterium]|nr:hypothetical protein [Chloroflexaceae bacterium]
MVRHPDHPPANVSAVPVSSSSIEVRWSPIRYTADGGYYQVRYATTPGGPYTAAPSPTADKTVDRSLVVGLNPDTTYFLVVQSFTPAHGEQQNDLTSVYSQEVSATTTHGNPYGTPDVPTLTPAPPASPTPTTTSIPTAPPTAMPTSTPAPTREPTPIPSPTQVLSATLPVAAVQDAWMQAYPPATAAPMINIGGIVYMDGEAIAGAEVELATHDGNQVTMITQQWEPGSRPYYSYRSSEHLPRLVLRANEPVTITARYSSHERSLRYVVQPGSQQVDIVLHRHQAQDYMVEGVLKRPARSTRAGWAWAKTRSSSSITRRGLPSIKAAISMWWIVKISVSRFSTATGICCTSGEPWAICRGSSTTPTGLP